MAHKKSAKKSRQKKGTSSSKSQSIIEVAREEEKAGLRLQIRLQVPLSLANDPALHTKVGILAAIRSVAEAKKSNRHPAIKLQAIDWERGRSRGSGGRKELVNFLAPILSPNSSIKIRVGKVREIQAGDLLEHAKNYDIND